MYRLNTDSVNSPRVCCLRRSLDTLSVKDFIAGGISRRNSRLVRCCVPHHCTLLRLSLRQPSQSPWTMVIVALKSINTMALAYVALIGAIESGPKSDGVVESNQFKDIIGRPSGSRPCESTDGVVGFRRTHHLLPTQQSNCQVTLE